MPSEDKKPIEKLLEASAQTRRGAFGADPTMPNPMRARLHQEISRATSSEEEKATRNRWWFSWPTLTALAALVVLVVGVSVFWRPKSQPITLSVRDELASNSNTNAFSAPVENRAAIASAAAPAAANLSRQLFKQETPKINFKNAYGLSGATHVLNSFQLSHDGNEIHIVDADGSTYTGKIEPLAKAKDAAKATTSTTFAAKTESASIPNESASNQFFFRATGRNSSLKKEVTFQGRYTPERVTGTAVIRGEAPVAIDASTAAP